MRIYKMTATFGKLEQATLELKPGLNIITAPNEWGKSTWCAFLIAMLYGVDTKAKTTRNSLADKERYAPWSGSPMAGRIDLHWEGRDITIERRTARRIPMGEFRVYETASGVPVTELTAANCGAMLLGVEQSVFRRAGFIRHGDLPVTQDEALRRRLNALVTTGDDSGAADFLATELKDLKNRCRYNRTGLLPQAEEEEAALEAKLAEMDDLELRIQRMHQKLDTIKDGLKQLYNHQQTLAYERMCGDIARAEENGLLLEQLRQEMQQLTELCETLPPQSEAERLTRELRAFREQRYGLQQELQTMPEEPQHPQLPLPFTGLSLEAAWAMVRKDGKRFAEISDSKATIMLILVGVLGMIAAAGLTFLKAYIYAAVAGAAGIVAVVWGFWKKISMRKQKRELLEKYGHGNWKYWADPIREYEHTMASYRTLRKEFQEIKADLEVRHMVLQKKQERLCGYEDPERCLDYWEYVQGRWVSYENTRRELLRAENYYDTMKSMIRQTEKPEMPDPLTHTEEETARLMSEYALEQQNLQNRLGQYQGQKELLGSRESLESQLKKVRDRILQLEKTYRALEIAQETLMAARTELQRRFAPRITQSAQKILERMTGGRYHSVTMGADFSLQAGADREETLHDLIWRSDGTVDQLYLALRLAVAEELTPRIPLILDDVLVRFDDERMRSAVEILRELAQNRQVILFTCQGRENDA